MKLKLVLFIFGLFAMIGCASATLNTYVVPAISDSVRILPNSFVSPSYSSNTISLNVSKGETTDCSFVLNPKQTIYNCNLSISSFTSGSNTLPASAIDIRYVVPWYFGTTDNFDEHITGRYLQPDLLVYDRSLIVSNVTSGNDPTVWNVSNPHGKNYIRLCTGEYQDISGTSDDGQAESLAENRPIYDENTLQATNLTAGLNQQYMITLRIPANTTPGTYTGTITATDETYNYTSINIAITVLPFQLDNSSIEYGMYYHSFIDPQNRAYIGWLNKSETQYKAELADLVDHGVMYPLFNPGLVGGPPIPNGVNDTWLIHMLDIRRDAGINDSNLYFWNEVDPSVKAYYRDLFAAHGVGQLYFYGPDEAEVNRTEIEYEHTLGIKHFNAQTITQSWNSEDILDLSVNHDIYMPTANDYHSYGNRISSYHQPMSAINYPELFRKNAGVVLWQNNYDGWFDFSYQWADNGDQWQTVWSHDNTVPYVFAYPTANGVADTLKWEGVREGYNDVRYITTLQNLINQNSSNATAIEAWGYLNSLKTANLSTLDMYAVRTQLQYYTYVLYTPPVNFSESVNQTTKIVTFTDNSTGKKNITSWNWNFGDGTQSTLQNPTHTYRCNGSYYVTETVNDTYLSYSITHPIYINSFLQNSYSGMALINLNNISTRISLINSVSPSNVKFIKLNSASCRCTQESQLFSYFGNYIRSNPSLTAILRLIGKSIPQLFTFTESRLDTCNPYLNITNESYTQSSGWLTGWNHRKLIRLNTSLVSGNLSNFTAVLPIVNDPDIGKYGNPTGSDIRITTIDGTTLLNYQRENYSISNGLANGFIWYTIPLLNNSTSNIGYLYYNTTSPNDGQNATATWNDGYNAYIGLLDTTATGHAGDFIDSSSGGGNSTNTINEPTVTNGIIGNGQYFNGTTYISVPGYSKLIDNNLTFSFWMNCSKNDTWIIDKGTGSSGYGIYVYSNNYPLVQIAGWSGITPGVLIQMNTTNFVTITFSKPNVYFYLNDIQYGPYTRNNNIGGNDTSLTIGGQYFYVNPTGYTAGGSFVGTIDQVEIATRIARSPQWISTKYNNQLSPASFNSLAPDISYNQYLAINSNDVFTYGNSVYANFQTPYDVGYTFNTNSNNSVVSWNNSSSGEVSIPFGSTDGTISSIILNKHTYVMVDGTRLYNSNLIFSPTLKIGYTDNVLLRNEKIENGTYILNLSYTPSMNFASDGIIKYTTCIQNLKGAPLINGNDSSASVNFSNNTFSITTGALMAGNTYNYNVSNTVDIP